MMRRTRWLTATSVLCVLGLLACEGTNPTMVPSAATATRGVTGQTDLGAEISALIATGFSPRGQAKEIAEEWGEVVKAVAKEQKKILKGKRVRDSEAREDLVHIVAYIQKKTGNATPPAGESQSHFVARLILDMSLYVYGGPSTPVPPVDPVSDVAFKLVQPGTTDTVVTPAKQAAVVLPPGSVGEPTVVVITPDSAYYPANCSGPLDTHLCQYPKFYRFNVFPDVKLGVSAKVQVCHIDAGAYRRPLADHQRFRIAHERPADPANYTTGSTIVDNVEILPLTPMAVTNCAAGDGTTYLPVAANLTPAGRFTSLAMGMVHRATSAVGRLLLPKDAYAIDIGVGGFVDDFSMFGVVDPSSVADLAQGTAPGSQFSLASPSLTVGGSAQVNGWNVRNAGSGTSAPFTSSVVIASDSLLMETIATVTVGGAAALVPGSTFAYPAMSLALPEGVGAGTYFIGTKVLPTGADSSVSDNLISVRVAVSSPTQTIGAAVWTGAGPGTVTATVNNPYLVTLGYNYSYPCVCAADFVTGYPFGGTTTDSHYVFPWQRWTYTTTAARSGSYSVDWVYTGDHAYFRAAAVLEAFVNGPNGEIVVPLRAYNPWVATSIDDDHDVHGPFRFAGNVTLNLTAGYTWGVRPAGTNYDGELYLNGTITLSDPVVIP